MNRHEVAGSDRPASSVWMEKRERLALRGFIERELLVVGDQLRPAAINATVMSAALFFMLSWCLVWFSSQPTGMAHADRGSSEMGGGSRAGRRFERNFLADSNARWAPGPSKLCRPAEHSGLET